MENGDAESASLMFKSCGAHVNRARLIITLILLPVWISFFWIDTILISLDQDPEIALMARNYVVWSIPGVFFLIQFDCTKRWLQSLFYSEVSTKV